MTHKAVGVRPEDEPAAKQPRALGRQRLDLRRLRPVLAHLEAERPSGEVAHERLAEADDDLGVHVVRVVVGRVHRVDHEGVLGLDQPLHQHGHLHKLLPDPGLLARVIGAVVPLGGPHALVCGAPANPSVGRGCRV